MSDLDLRMVALRARIQELEAALEHYANKGQWNSMDDLSEVENPSWDWYQGVGGEKDPKTGLYQTEYNHGWEVARNALRRNQDHE